MAEKLGFTVQSRQNYGQTYTYRNVTFIVSHIRDSYGYGDDNGRLDDTPFLEVCFTSGYDAVNDGWRPFKSDRGLEPRQGTLRTTEDVNRFAGICRRIVNASTWKDFGDVGPDEFAEILVKKLRATRMVYDPRFGFNVDGENVKPEEWNRYNAKNAQGNNFYSVVAESDESARSTVLAYAAEQARWSERWMENLTFWIKGAQPVVRAEYDMPDSRPVAEIISEGIDRYVDYGGSEVNAKGEPIVTEEMLSHLEAQTDEEE